jgi:transcriptional regulator with XRE-family HTH domain
MLGIGSAALAATKDLRASADAAMHSPRVGSAFTKALSRAHAVSASADALLSLNPLTARPALWAKTGGLLRQLREQAGLTLSEVGQAVNLDDPGLLAAVEKGRATLPFEIILRLAAMLGRKDPVSAFVSLTRTSSPQVWEALESAGFGMLMLQSAREREFVNVLRAADRARELGDAEFAELLAFVKAAFELAMAFKHRKAGAPRS